MTIEDRIKKISRLKDAPPFCWLICFEKRPLQGIPPGGSGPHLMAFYTEVSANAFMAGRGKYYPNEPLSAIKINSAESLKGLLSEPCSDPRYAEPPCGLVIDFNYATGKARRVISPSGADKIEASEIAQAFLAPPIPVSRQKISWNTSTKMIAGIVGGIAGIIILVFAGVGVFTGMETGKIPAFSFLSTPTLTPTPTQTPTPIPTSTPTAQPWQIHYTDSFVNNKWGWPELQNDSSGGCGTEAIAIENFSLVWKIDVTDGCVWWQYPSFTQMKDFDYSLDVEQMTGSSNGDMGLIYSAAGDYSYSLLFRVDPFNQTFVVDSLQTDWKTIIDWKYSSAIHSSGVNRLRMVAKDNEFTFYVNDVEVGSTFDSTITSGVIGITLGTYNTGDSLSVSFDNLDLYTNR